MFSRLNHDIFYVLRIVRVDCIDHVAHDVRHVITVSDVHSTVRVFNHDDVLSRVSLNALQYRCIQSSFVLPWESVLSQLHT